MKLTTDGDYSVIIGYSTTVGGRKMRLALEQIIANKKINKDLKQLAFAPSSLILANNFKPVI